MKNNIAIIVGGGGMRCAYAAGALIALAKELKLTEPDIVIGVSGGASNLAYYVSGQYDSLKNIWINLVTTKRYISFLRLRHVVDVSYLIDVIVKKDDPLNTDNIKNSKTKLFIAATDCDTGRPEYFSNQYENILEAMRASVTIPIVDNKYTLINDKKYIEGGIGSPLESNIEKAIEEGATKIIVIKSEVSSMGSSFFWKFYSLFVNKNLRRAIKSYVAEKPLPIMSENVSIIYIKPTKKLPAWELDNKKIHVQDMYSLGYNDVIENKELREFLQ